MFFSTGHYTQVVWAETEYVGCARAIYEADGWYTVQLTCNYAGRNSSGNLLTRPMYLTGPPCTKCPGKKCNSIWRGLCGDDVPVNQQIHRPAGKSKLDRGENEDENNKPSGKKYIIFLVHVMEIILLDQTINFYKKIKN